MGQRSADLLWKESDKTGNINVAQEVEGTEYNKKPKWARNNRSYCCGVIILYYGEDFKGFCPKCGRDL